MRWDDRSATLIDAMKKNKDSSAFKQFFLQAIGTCDWK